MKYLLILLLGVGAIVGLTIANPFGLFNSLRSNVVEVVNPPSAQAKMIDSLKEKYKTLDTLLTLNNTAAIRALPAKEKEFLKAAEQILGESQDLLAELEVQEEQNRPGVVQTIIQKILKSEQSQPTSIPPHCQLQCKAQ